MISQMIILRASTMLIVLGVDTFWTCWSVSKTVLFTQHACLVYRAFDRITCNWDSFVSNIIKYNYKEINA